MACAKEIVPSRRISPREVTDLRDESRGNTRGLCHSAQTVRRAIHYPSLMRTFLRALAVTALLLAPAAAANAQITFGIHIGEPPAPRAYRVPPRPGPDYVWVEGYQYPQGSRYVWHDGYWTRPPYEGAYWVAPYHTDGQYFTGRWEGSRGNVEHDHSWDKGNQRDERREPRPDGRSNERR
jgi:hypothetical protein